MERTRWRTRRLCAVIKRTGIKDFYIDPSSTLYETLFTPHAPVPLEMREQAAIGEKRLWAAVLLEALGAKTKLAQKEVMCWVRMGGDYIGTFNWICSILELSPKPIRKKILTAMRNGRAMVCQRKKVRIAA